MQKTDFRNGMRRLASAVSIITTGRIAGSPQGLTASAVCSLSAEPPRLLVCVNKSASAHDAILRNGVFCVNVLSQSQSNLAQVFATTDSMDQRFQEGEWAGLETGSPVLENAMVSFDCRIGETVAQSTHTIVIGDVVAMRGGSGSEPLLYYDGAYGRVLNG